MAIQRGGGFALLGAPKPVVIPRWLPIALGEIGVLEDTRPGMSNARIEMYHGATAGGPALDDVAWCSSWLCWVFEQARIRSPRSKRAADWQTWGIEVPLDQLQLYFGCVIGFPKSDKDAVGSGHVALDFGLSGNQVFALGGNQDNRIGIDIRDKRKIAWARYPIAVELPG
jgi:uncharacterized protein (TIGR02594 family)